MEKSQKPIEKGQQLTIELTGEGKKGDGIAKVEGFIIVVPRGQQGRKYKVQVTEVYSSYAFAKIVREIKEEGDE